MNAFSQTRTTSRWQLYGVYAVIGLLTLGYLFFGGTKLIGADMHVGNFTRWGYPLWFMYVTGLIELLSTVLLWSSKTRFFGALGLVCVMIGAVLTHLTHNEASMIGLPLVLLVLSSIVAWASRPARV